MAAAEAGLQDAVAEVLANKKARDVELRNASRVLQHMDEDRLAKLVHMLRQVIFNCFYASTISHSLCIVFRFNIGYYDDVNVLGELCGIH